MSTLDQTREGILNFKILGGHKPEIRCFEHARRRTAHLSAQRAISGPLSRILLLSIPCREYSGCFSRVICGTTSPFLDIRQVSFHATTLVFDGFRGNDRSIGN